MNDKAIRQEELAHNRYVFFCDGCRKIHQLSLYAICQLASKNDLVHKCPVTGHEQRLSHKKFSSKE